MTNPAKASHQKSTYVESLKRERDRFVALAFCAADVLIEADADCKITYAAGATVGVTGYPSDDLIGDSLLEIIAPDDRPILRELIRGMTVGKRLQPIPIRLIGPKGLTPQLLLTGYVLPNLPGSLFFALRPWTEGNQSDEKSAKSRDKESGLYKTGSFLEQVEKIGGNLDVQLVGPPVRLQPLADQLPRWRNPQPKGEHIVGLHRPSLHRHAPAAEGIRSQPQDLFDSTWNVEEPEIK